ncbi:hypothetical protein F7725_020489 [Dissostichus mawsoni]|uniref:Ubiquitin carboxyl-terminal hydrolase n=1 Tax=Dissostichus mawsoni TaxID=36200 RepID=A0A7J5YEQ8_DISMA|nr:hypothetical protein F7725_020489 [Dissostichus mawsoni]
MRLSPLQVKMGKKRGKDKSSREEDDFEITVPSCRHIKKGSDQTLLKKLSGSGDWTSCQDCKPEENEENEENKENISTTVPLESEEEKEMEPMWMCLKCGHRGCGRNSENQHAIKHYETPRSEPHCLVISLDNWSVWCYICDDEVQYSRTGHLAQLLTNLKKQTSADPIKRPQKRVKEEACLLEVEQKTETVKAEEKEDKEHEDNKENKDHPKKNAKKESVVKSQKSGTSEDIGGISVRGLSNLGNTCFFNSVIQNLSQTHLLRQTLNKMTEEKKELNIQPVASSDLEPLVLHLDRPGSLTMAMCQLLNEIQESKKGVVTPRELFSQRVSTGIMEALKGSKKSTDGEQLKTLVKEYEKNGFPKNVVDHVFGGETTSTIMCQQCKTVSVVTEMFLDLSLPVSDEAYRKKKQKKEVHSTSESSQDGRNSPALTNGNDDIPEGSGSKYQQKKAKKQAKKQAKQQKRQTKLGGRVTLDCLSSPSQTESEQTDPTDPDAEDGENADNGTNEEATLIGETPAQISVSEEDQKTLETDEKEKEKEEEEEDDDLVNECDSSATSSVSNRFTALSEEQPSKDSVLDNDKISDMDQEVEQDTELVSEMEKVTLDDAFIEDSLAVDQSMESEEEEAKEYTVVSQDPDLAFHTLATRKAPEKQECSVQSCLFQFTEVETLTQNNSLLCVTCTKRQPSKEKAGASKKNVYTDALKQMLISSPPPVLTLHLKRFQQNGYNICKVNRHVQFPLILDLAPFCAVKCKNLTEGDNQILYSLYGIVEHSGTMRSGHYTAYVKARPECPKLSSNGCTAEGRFNRGSWFHVSDTSVQPVSESKVQGCQAYLLFYERIL